VNGVDVRCLGRLVCQLRGHGRVENRVDMRMIFASDLIRPVHSDCVFSREAKGEARRSNRRQAHARDTLQSGHDAFTASMTTLPS